MKKFLCMMLIVLLFSGCSSQCQIWKEIDIDGVGTLKIPQSWVYNKNDNIIYFTDKKMSYSNECVMYMTGIIGDPRQFSSLYEHIGENMKYEKLISSEVFSNSATIGENEYIINNKKVRKSFLELYSSDKSLYIIVLDDSVDYDTIKKIGTSYKMYVRN